MDQGLKKPWSDFLRDATFLASQTIITLILLGTNLGLDRLIYFLFEGRSKFEILGVSLTDISSVTFQIITLLIVATYALSLLFYFLRRFSKVFSEGNAE